MNVEEFWKQRNQSRAALDQKRSKAPFGEKLRIAEQLRKDMLLFKSSTLYKSIMQAKRELKPENLLTHDQVFK